MEGLHNLYSDITIRGKKIKNRIVLAPMGTRSNFMDGTLSDRCSIYLEERAKGGAGLILPELTSVKEGYTWIPSMQIYSDRLIPSLSRLASSVHAYDSKIMMQLALHGGRAASWVTRNRCIAPSAIASPTYKEIPEALTRDEIHELVEDWRTASIRTKRADFDGVEVHGGHGYLINQFMSPATNKRDDEYGGNLTNRMRFAKEIVEAIRESCGPEFIIGFKMTALELLENGIDEPMSLEMAKELEIIGVDYLHISTLSSTMSVHAYTPYPSVPSMYDGKNCMVPLAANIKKVVSIPVITTGAIVDPEDADSIIGEGKADMVAIGRAFLADAHWGLKPIVKENIKPCIGCQTCHKHTIAGTELVCSVNPGLLREFRDLAVPLHNKKKKVLIIGGGPAGMEAAIQASSVGHDVVLYERSANLGGELIAASRPYFKARVKSLLDYYEKEIHHHLIDLRINQPFDYETVDKHELGNFDLIIVANGAKPSIPGIQGIGNSNIHRAEKVILDPDAYDLGKSIIIIGAGKIGLEAAWMLAEIGKSVQVLEQMPADKILFGEHPTTKSTLLHNLEIRGVRIIAECKVDRIDQHSMGYVVCDEDLCTVPMDSVLLATGYKSDSVLFDTLKRSEHTKMVYEIGDGKKVRGMTEAIQEGYFLGRYGA